MKPISEREPDNEEIARTFEGKGDIRSNCGCCGKAIIGTIDELSEHFRNCNGLG